MGVPSSLIMGLMRDRRRELNGQSYDPQTDDRNARHSSSNAGWAQGATGAHVIWTLDLASKGRGKSSQAQKRS